MIRLDPYACLALISPGKKKKGLSESMEIVSLNKQEILSLCMLRSKSGNTLSIWRMGLLVQDLRADMHDAIDFMKEGACPGPIQSR